MKEHEILEQFMNEAGTLDSVLKARINLNAKKDKTPQIIYSEKTKEMFKQFKQEPTDEKTATKQKAERTMGKASQRRGSGRGCI